MLICLRCDEEWEPYIHLCDILFGDTLVRKLEPVTGQATE